MHFFHMLLIIVVVALSNITHSLTDDKANENDNELYNKLMDETSTLLDMWELLDCDREQAKKLHIHNESTCAFLRGSYIGSVGYPNSTIRHNNLYANGFGIDAIEVKHHPLKGRAVYANRTFKKDDIVYRNDFSGCFEEGSLYRKFLASIPPYLACDVFQWAYSGKSYGVCVDLDEGSFINHASASDTKNRDWESGKDSPNLLGGTIASRTIEIGEELLTDYSEFAELDGWAELGLGGWDEEENNNNDDDYEEHEANGNLDEAAESEL